MECNSYIFALVGISGVGKSHLISNSIANSNYNLNRLIAATTRYPRNGEIDKIDKYFYTENDFSANMSKFCFINSVYNCHYAYLKKDFLDSKIYLCEFFYKHISELRQALQDRLIIIYVKSSNLDDTIKRINSRTKSPIENNLRKSNLHEELKDLEQLESQHFFDYVFVNDYTPSSEQSFLHLLEQCIKKIYEGNKNENSKYI